MSKIVKAVNAMIENEKLISPVLYSKSAEKEFFFLYSKKTKWSIFSHSEGFNLYYYPDPLTSLEILASLTSSEIDGISSVIYKTSELKTQEALESFSELFKICSEKVYGIDDILDDIINFSV